MSRRGGRVQKRGRRISRRLHSQSIQDDSGNSDNLQILILPEQESHRAETAGSWKKQEGVRIVQPAKQQQWFWGGLKAAKTADRKLRDFRFQRNKILLKILLVLPYPKYKAQKLIMTPEVLERTFG